jgi:hypothetical protein
VNEASSGDAAFLFFFLEQSQLFWSVCLFYFILPHSCSRSTLHLFDGKREMAPGSDEDRLSVLVDDLLWHVLSFLPGDDALQTCVLSPRWRDLWRSTTNLRFNLDDWPSIRTRERFEQLVKLFIHLRGKSPLVKCKINAYPDESDSYIVSCTYTYTKMLIKYALTCQAEELIVNTLDFDEDPPAFDVPLISQHLKTIHLDWVYLEGSGLNFSRCTVLEELKMQHCMIHAHKISSKSLKRMYITNSCSFLQNSHTRIFAPGLTDLQLDGFEGLPPFLEYMPFLVTGYVGLSEASHEFCHQNHNCGCHASPVEEGLFLNGLSNALNLELIAERGMVCLHLLFFFTLIIVCDPQFLL